MRQSSVYDCNIIELPKNHQLCGNITSVNNQNEIPFETTQKKFLLGIFLSKIVPLILLIFGIIKMTHRELSELYLPWAIILVAALIGLVLINKLKKENENEPTKVYIDFLITFTRPLMLTLPIMAVAFLYLMTYK